MKLEFSRHLYERLSNIKFRENLYSVNTADPFRWTDRHHSRYYIC